MGSMTLDIDGWRKKSVDDNPEPVEKMSFFIDEECHLELEKAELLLQKKEQSELFLETTPSRLKLDISPDCGPLSSCRIRVYRNPDDGRCHFHLAGHRASDNSIVYSNSILIDNLL